MKVTKGIAGMNAKGKGSLHMEKLRVVEVRRKRELARRLFWKRRGLGWAGY